MSSLKGILRPKTLRGNIYEEKDLETPLLFLLRSSLSSTCGSVSFNNDIPRWGRRTFYLLDPFSEIPVSRPVSCPQDSNWIRRPGSLRPSRLVSCQTGRVPGGDSYTSPTMIRTITPLRQGRLTTVPNASPPPSQRGPVPVPPRDGDHPVTTMGATGVDVSF